DVPAMTMQSPVVTEGPGAGLRATLHLLGTNSTRDYARAGIGARRISIGGEWDQVNGETTLHPGVLFLESTHSIASDRHAPITTYLQSQPSGTGSSGEWVDFTDAQFPSIDFTTAWSGRVKITVQQ